MASVYYLFDDALHVADDIVDKYSQQDKNQKENHYAATVIQRSYRGYVVRKSYKKYIYAVIVLQKYVKSWLVRYHLPDILHETWDQMCLNDYNVAATRIQAIWKGILVRNEIDIKAIMEEKRKAALMAAGPFESQSLDLVFNADKKESQMKQPPMDETFPFGGTPLGQEKIIRRRILELMFDRHHLLSTTIHRGVLDTNSELKEIEKVLKSLKWKDYVKEMKKMCYRYQKKEKYEKPAYKFANKEMRKEEDLLKLRDNSHDIREEYMGDCIADKRKPFIPYRKLDEQAYEKSLLYEGKYIKQECNITRTDDSSKNISKTDFILTLKEISKKCNIPPYYADFWYKECIGHHFSE